MLDRGKESGGSQACGWATLHRVKGLEFPVMIVAGVNPKSYPCGWPGRGRPGRQGRPRGAGAVAAVRGGDQGPGPPHRDHSWGNPQPVSGDGAHVGTTKSTRTMSIQGNIKAVKSLSEPLQVGMDNGARRALIPLENKRSFLEVSGDVIERVDPIFYADPMTAAMKGLGMTGSDTRSTDRLASPATSKISSGCRVLRSSSSSAIVRISAK